MVYILCNKSTVSPAPWVVPFGPSWWSCVPCQGSPMYRVQQVDEIPFVTCFVLLSKVGCHQAKSRRHLAASLLGCSIWFTLLRSKGDWFRNSLPSGTWNPKFCYWILEEQKWILEDYPTVDQVQKAEWQGRGYWLNWRWYGTHWCEFPPFQLPMFFPCLIRADLPSQEGTGNQRNQRINNP